MNVLAAFDFDHTICDGNTDTVARDLLPWEKIPRDVRELHRSSGWIPYMSRIFELLHENAIGAEAIENAIVGIPAVAGMETFLRSLSDRGAEIVIISDSNSVFIDRWLRSRRLEDAVERVFTNPARYDDRGGMRVAPYHTQRTCKLSSVNLCKGQILMDYFEKRREQGKRFGRIVYVGDGQNDLCPLLRLSQFDVACPRRNYPLVKLLRDNSIEAPSLPWDDGTDLCNHAERILARGPFRS